MCFQYGITLLAGLIPYIPQLKKFRSVKSTAHTQSLEQTRGSCWNSPVHHYILYSSLIYDGTGNSVPGSVWPKLQRGVGYADMLQIKFFRQ